MKVYSTDYTIVWP